jgi:hypothetical protein
MLDESVTAIPKWEGCLDDPMENFRATSVSYLFMAVVMTPKSDKCDGSQFQGRACCCQQPLLRGCQLACAQPFFILNTASRTVCVYLPLLRNLDAPVAITVNLTV